LQTPSSRLLPFAGTATEIASTAEVASTEVPSTQSTVAGGASTKVPSTQSTVAGGASTKVVAASCHTEDGS